MHLYRSEDDVKSLVGQEFGQLTVIARAPHRAAGKSRGAAWLCKCKCGRECYAPSKYLRLGQKKSCGCLSMRGYLEDLTGRKFGRLCVLAPATQGPKGARWLCACGCGKNHEVYGHYLRQGVTKSCGCLRVAKRLKHGFSRHGSRAPEYRLWTAMLQRCNNSRCRDYPRYGGRGIKVCERWRVFLNFYADMCPRPAKDLSLDRINNDGNYEPGNVRWATMAIQASNRRKPTRLNQ